jgi:rRNA pseudouridine-1189 N-methylase Emg1 (Nep1/Mra1 family)
MQDLAARNQSLEAKLLLKEQELAALAALAAKEKRLGPRTRHIVLRSVLTERVDCLARLDRRFEYARL